MASHREPALIDSNLVTRTAWPPVRFSRRAANWLRVWLNMPDFKSGARSLPNHNITRSITPITSRTTDWLSNWLFLCWTVKIFLLHFGCVPCFVFVYVFCVLLAKCSLRHAGRISLLFVVIVTVYDAYRVPLSAAHILCTFPLTVIVGSVASGSAATAGDLVRCLISNATLARPKLS